jgi:polar amino acid transport system substrate-binding protein
MAGAEKLKIGVTGDLPPLDLTLADGKPAGFSTAVLAEISKRLGKNIELVPIDSAARASALSSNRVDVVFWVAVPKDSEIIPADVDTPKDVELTKPYYEDLIVHVVQKK